MAKVELKAPVVAEIAEAVKDAQSVVLVDYRGLTVEQDTALMIIIVMLLGNILNVLCKILNKL